MLIHDKLNIPNHGDNSLSNFWAPGPNSISNQLPIPKFLHKDTETEYILFIKELET